jgi:proteasome lid subunit RPN8/RPN11
MSIHEEILAHAKKEFPRESCGVVVVFKGREIYLPCRNIANNQGNEFVIHPKDYSDACDKGQVVKIVHSHPKSSHEPSIPDKVGIEETKIPWVIVNPTTGLFSETKPSGYRAPLVGREYSYGVLDCFSIVRDYYKDVLNIDLPDKDREGFWWNQGKNLFVESYESYGFVKVKDLQKHDLILMFNGANVPNHFGVYVGGGAMIHHAQNRLSSKDVYGNAGYWYRNTWGYLRHIDLM